MDLSTSSDTNSKISIEDNEPTDCIVLEIFSDQYKKAFILFDFYENCFFIYGIHFFQNYFNFRCNNISSIINFIKITFGVNLQLLLHNYKAIPYKANQVQFDYLSDYFEDNSYQCDTLSSKKVCAKIFSSYLKNHLSIIRDFYNKY